MFVSIFGHAYPLYYQGVLKIKDSKKRDVLANRELKDFLITYGWAIAVIIVFLAILVINPGIFIANIDRGILVADAKVNVNGTLELLLRNNMDIDSFNILVDVSGCNVTNKTVESIKKYENAKLVFEQCGGEYLVGASFKRTATIYYEIGSGERINHTVERKVSAKVE